jgi:small subunit ribosomal protein S21
LSKGSGAGLALFSSHATEDAALQVLVRDNNIEQAMRVLKKKMQREGVFREMRRRKAYEKPSEKRVREQADAIRRSRKLARKQAQRDGLLPMPKPKVKPAMGMARG